MSEAIRIDGWVGNGFGCSRRRERVQPERAQRTSRRHPNAAAAPAIENSPRNDGLVGEP